LECLADGSQSAPELRYDEGVVVFPEPGSAIGWVAAVLCVASCGDNLSGDVPELQPVDTLIVVAHLDDDMIFMQPELRAAIEAGSVTTVYVSSGDAVHGRFRSAHTFRAARTAYGKVAGSSDWDCRYVMVNGSPLHHCQVHDQAVSLVGPPTADGGLYGEYPRSPLHLMEDMVPDIPIVGRMRGTATKDSIIDSLFRIITITQPRQIHTLDLAATHGRDHSGHLFASSFALWAAARARYQGEIRWHRGYNVDDEPANLDDADYQAARSMLGYFEACYFGCGKCGTSCSTLDHDHDFRMRRQYSSTRAPLEAQGALALAGSGACVALTDARSVALGDCSGAASVHLDPRGHLVIGDACLASGPGNDDPVVLQRCRDTPEQYWIVDSDGFVWNGRPPQAVPDMDYDHVRCLDVGATPDAPLTSPICGAHRQPHWQFVAP
jgi:hypothetical protein